MVESHTRPSEEDKEKIAVGKCNEHGIVTEHDGAEIRFPTTAECHCGQELDRATIADPQEVQQYV